MKRNPREKAARRKEVAEREAKQGRIKAEKERARARKKYEHKKRGKSISSGPGSGNWRRSYFESCSESGGESCEEGGDEGETDSRERRKRGEIDDLYETMKEWNGLKNSNRLTRS